MLLFLRMFFLVLFCCSIKWKWVVKQLQIMRQIKNPFFYRLWPVLSSLRLTSLNVLANHIDCNGHRFVYLLHCACTLRYDFEYIYTQMNENLSDSKQKKGGKIKTRRNCDKAYAATNRSHTHTGQIIYQTVTSNFSYFIRFYQLSLSNCHVYDAVR